MNCGICAIEITEGQKKTELECGCNYHTVCAVEAYKRFFIFEWPQRNLRCAGCQVIVIEAQPTTPQHEQTDTILNVHLQQPTFLADVKKLKAKGREMRSKLRLVNATIREQKIAFFNLINPHIAAITEAKRNSVQNLKQQQTYIDYAKASRSYKAHMTILLRKYNLNRREIRRLFPLRNVWRERWTANLSWIIRRKFRIRL